LQVWKQLAGKSGWLVVCRDCGYQVAFFMEAEN
jgi:hypothetical protein